MAEDLFRGGHRTKRYLRKKNLKVAWNEEGRKEGIQAKMNLSCLLKMIVFTLLSLTASLFQISPLSTSQTRNTSETIYIIMAKIIIPVLEFSLASAPF